MGGAVGLVRLESGSRIDPDAHGGSFGGESGLRRDSEAVGKSGDSGEWGGED